MHPDSPLTPRAVHLCHSCGKTSEARSSLTRRSPGRRNFAWCGERAMGLLDVARHVIDTHFPPSCVELTDVLSRSEKHLAVELTGIL